jgi:hypothetical protein
MINDSGLLPENSGIPQPVIASECSERGNLSGTLGIAASLRSSQ